jgi:hypothetical protein
MNDKAYLQTVADNGCADAKKIEHKPITEVKHIIGLFTGF